MKTFSSAVTNSEFAKDVLNGLQATPKYLKSKYFYDQRGDELFQEIMKLPEYYLTDCELEILEQNKDRIIEIIGPKEHFHLLDLGAGDAAKTKILLKHFVEQKLDFTYCPVDISSHAIQEVSEKLRKEIPGLTIRGISKQYLQAMEQFPASTRKIILFLGSSIGNFNNMDSQKFLQEICLRMNENDWLIIGFDLKKDPEVILKAYNDSSGVTRQFNLNLLQRINRELEGRIDVDSFEHVPSYDQETGEARSRLVSTKDQLMEIPSLGLSIEIRKGESIHTEISKKYELQEIEGLATASGLEVVTHLMDSRNYFTDSVWRKKT